MRAGLSMET